MNRSKYTESRIQKDEIAQQGQKPTMLPLHTQYSQNWHTCSQIDSQAKVPLPHVFDAMLSVMNKN